MPDPINAAGMSPQQKLTFLQDQILQIRAGTLKWMLCPYCGGENHPTNEFLCCEMFDQATRAIFDRMEKQDAIDFMSTAADNAVRRVN